MEAFFSQVGLWKFDPISSFLTIVLVPTGIYILVIIRRFLKEAVGYLIDGIVYALNKIVVHRVAASLTIKRYCRLQLAGSTKFLRIPASTEITIDIDRIFVPLVLENPGVSATYNSSSLLDAGNRVRVVGDPGSGKSSAAKRLFRDECKRALSTPARSRFPIFLELRSLEIPKSILNAKLGDWMLDHIRALCAKYDVYNLEKCFDIYANKTGLLVILDGLDEVASSSYPRIASAINGLSIKLQQLGEENAVVLTLRTQFHQQTKADFDDSYPKVLLVKRFNPSDIYEFLTRWPFASSSFENVVRIYNDLTDRPSLREMCTNPLVLSMYVAQDQIAGYQIAPDSRTEFYSKVAEELLIRRRAKQIGALTAQAAVREQRQRILGKIAFEHLCDPEQSPNHLVWNDAVQVVMDIVGMKKRDQAEAYLRDLAKETGLIGEEQEGESYRFIHLTFCEFFCAFEAVHGRSDGWHSLLSSHQRFRANPASRTRLVESLPFATALLPRHGRDEALDQIALCEDQHLLAMTFLETKNYTHPRWVTFVDGSIASLNQSSRQNWDADWLRELHLFLVVASDAERASNVLRGIAKADAVTIFFKEFAKREAESLSRLIASYAEQDAAAAFRVASLCEVDLLEDVPEVIVASCSQPPFIAIALERALREPESTYLWASLFAEGGLGSRAAANALSNRTERPWQKNVDEIASQVRWSNSGFYPNSFYIDCVSLGWNAHLNLAATPLLNILSKISPPNTSAWTAIGGFCAKFWPIAFLILYGYTGLVIVELLASRKIVPFMKFLFSPFTPEGVIILIVAICVILVGSVAGSRFQLYQVVLNFPATIFYNPRVFFQFVVAKHFGARSLALPDRPFTVNDRDEVEWDNLFCRGALRSNELISLSRQIILKREQNKPQLDAHLQ
jgi:NACHT domain